MFKAGILDKLKEIEEAWSRLDGLRTEIKAINNVGRRRSESMIVQESILALINYLEAALSLPSREAVESELEAIGDVDVFIEQLNEKMKLLK